MYIIIGNVYEFIDHCLIPLDPWEVSLKVQVKQKKILDNKIVLPIEVDAAFVNIIPKEGVSTFFL